MDVGRIRDDFPILARDAHGKSLVYLDSAATSQKPTAVIGAEDDFYRRSNANVHRGVYELSVEATDAYEAARAKVARFIHAPDPAGVVFVRGTTEAINLVATSLGRSLLHRGDRVVTTIMEHHSNIVPWHFLREYGGIDLQFVGVDDGGRLRIDELDRLLADRRTKVVTVTHVSNVLGTVNPVREIADRAHAAGALVVVDAAQSVPHRPVDVRALGADFVAFSGHKMLGPMGIGVLWGAVDRLNSLPPGMGGGEMISEVHTDRVSYRESPARFEAGTPNVAGAIGLGAAVDYLSALGWDDMRSHSRDLQREMFRGLDRFGGRLTIHGPPDGPEREAVLSFSLKGAHPHDIASLLDEDGICVRAGHHCAQPLMEHLGVSALTRASPYVYNTTEEIERLLTALERVDGLFGGAAGRTRAS